MSHNTANAKADRPEPTFHHCKKPGHYKNQCTLLKKQREQTEKNQKDPCNKTSDANTSISNSNVNNHNYNNKNTNGAEIMPKTVFPHCETYGKTIHSTEKCYYGANAANRLPPRHRRPKKAESGPKESQSMKLLGYSPEFKLKMPRLRSGAAIDRPETTKLPSIPQVVWQQLQETHLTNIHKISTTETHWKTRILESKPRNDVEAQKLPTKEALSQLSDPIRNRSWKTELGAHQYDAPMTPRNNIMKSNEMKLAWQPMKMEMTTFSLPK